MSAGICRVLENDDGRGQNEGLGRHVKSGGLDWNLRKSGLGKVQQKGGFW